MVASACKKVQFWVIAIRTHEICRRAAVRPGKPGAGGSLPSAPVADGNELSIKFGAKCPDAYVRSANLGQAPNLADNRHAITN
jgi:hypothetical protein